jgi:hypothetical protein
MPMIANINMIISKSRIIFAMSNSRQGKEQVAFMIFDETKGDNNTW